MKFVRRRAAFALLTATVILAGGLLQSHAAAAPPIDQPPRTLEQIKRRTENARELWNAAKREAAENRSKLLAPENPANTASAPDNRANTASEPDRSRPPVPPNTVPLPPQPTPVPRSARLDAPFPPSQPPNNKPAQPGSKPKTGDTIPVEGTSPEPAHDPRKLKSIREILPYADYDPTPGVQDDPCGNLCPRPGTAKCRQSEGLMMIDCPEEVTLGDRVYEGRHMPAAAFQWKASNLYHNPLYFEDVGLERYGHVHDSIAQPFVSVGLFGVQLIGLPYQMTIDEVQRKIYTLGHYRPGDCVPKKYYIWPWNTEAALIQAGATVGAVYILP